MSKTELVEFIAEQADLTKADAARALQATIDGITEGLKTGGRVSLVGFGTFNAKQRAARDGINPLTKEKFVFQLKLLLRLKQEANLKML